MLIRLAIISTHPIQYNAPLYAMLEERGNIKIRVFYTWGTEVLKDKYDPGFGQSIQWDIPLLQGYDYTFVNNIANDKGSHHFKGIDNPTLVNEITEWGADAVLVYGWSFKSHLKVIRSFHGRIPVLFRGDSTSLQRSSLLKKNLRRIFLKWVYKHVDYVLYVGTHNRQYYTEYGLKESQMLFAPHAIDNVRFRSVVKQNLDQIQQWRESLGIDREARVFLYAGKMDGNKNVGLLTAAFCKLKQTDVHLILAGDGPLKADLQLQYAKVKTIHFLSFQNQSKMPLLYGLSDVYVLPSLSETWGLAINEAMACEKAILASDSCGATIDLVHENVNGFAFRSGSLDDLLDKLKIMSGSKNALVAMGGKSGEIINDWNYAATCLQIENTLQSFN